MSQKWHHRGDGVVSRCSATTSANCPFDTKHFATEDEAKQYAEQKMMDKFADKYFGTKKRSPEKRSPLKGSQPVIDRTYEPHPSRSKEEERVKERYVEDNESPNSRLVDNPDDRYMAAQERSRRVSGKREVRSEDKKIQGVKPLAGVYTFSREEKDSAGRPVSVTIAQKTGQLHSGENGWGYEDHKVKVSYHEGVVHADEEVEGPAVILKDSNSELYINHGLLHRVSGPAVVTPHEIEYWRHGLLHRTGGPAVVRSNGEEEYWDKGVFQRKVTPEPPKPDEVKTSMAKSKAFWRDEERLEKAAQEKKDWI